MTLLTADDVLNKKFQATKFREGYEQDEVDEFLDKVVEAMRQLGLRVRFVLSPDVIACRKRRRTLCHLHLYPLAGRIVGKGCRNAVFCNAVGALERSVGDALLP